MIQEKKSYDTKDLILKVKKHYDKSKLKLDYYDRFLEALCGNREYQKQAIQNAIIYLASGEYNVIEDLVKANHYDNPELRKRYPELDEYCRKSITSLPIKNHRKTVK